MDKKLALATGLITLLSCQNIVAAKIAKKTGAKPINETPQEVIKQATTHSSFVMAGKPINLKISGKLNQAAVYADDGKENNLFFTTNENAVSRLKITGEAAPSQNIKAKAQVELGFKVNPSTKVSQANHSPTPSIDMRKVEISISSKHFGRIWLGKGSTASDNSSEVDLSGTNLVVFSGVDFVGGSLFFRSTNTKNYSQNPQISNVFNNLDGLGRKSRFRYDTPSLFGFYASTSVIENNANDVAIKYGKKFNNTELAGAADYTSTTTIGSTKGNIISGSFSVLFPCGLNGTISSGLLNTKTRSRKNPYFYYAKLGYQKKLFQSGKSAISIDYGNYINIAQNNDKGTTYGVAAVQDIVSLNLAIYAGYRVYKLHRTNMSFKNINTVIAGAAFVF